ncbi:MAG: DMT family transporter [Pseudomonadota bacterium]|nr:DMT family transporter [Pseudomonadota bacterium]
MAEGFVRSQDLSVDGIADGQVECFTWHGRNCRQGSAHERDHFRHLKADLLLGGHRDELNMPLNKIKIDMALVFSAGVLWSTVGIGVRLIETANVWQILLYRSMSLSVFLLLIIACLKKSNPIKSLINTGYAGLIGGFALLAAYSGGIYSIQKISVANALLLFATAPFFAALLGRLFLGEKISLVTWSAIGAALAGVFVMVSDKFGSSSLGGSVAALGSAVGFAAFTLALRHGKSTEMLPTVFLSGLLALPLTGLICVSTGSSVFLSQNDTVIALVMGVFQVGLGLVLYTIGSKTIPAAELTLLSLSEVMLAPIWVWMFLDEIPDKLTLLGGAIILSALVGTAVAKINRGQVPETSSL